MADTYSSAEVIEAAKISYRQLDYWCRNGHLGDELWQGPGAGNPRAFTLAQRDRIVRMGDLVRLLGVSPARAAQLADADVITLGSIRLRVEATDPNLATGDDRLATA